MLKAAGLLPHTSL